jgi:hypothetical protein
MLANPAQQIQGPLLVKVFFQDWGLDPATSIWDQPRLSHCIFQKDHVTGKSTHMHVLHYHFL